MSARWLLCGAAGALAGLCLGAAALATPVPGQNGTFEVTIYRGAADTSSDSVAIKYTPDPSKVTCTLIDLVQTCRISAQDGRTLYPKDFANSATMRSIQTVVTAGGTFVDHKPTEKDAAMNGDDPGKDNGEGGTCDGEDVAPSTASDRPRAPDDSYPAGVTTIVFDFEVCAVCADPYRVLDCIHWSYVRTKGGTHNGKCHSAASCTPPSSEFVQAVQNFNSTHADGTVCPEEEAEKNATMPDGASRGFGLEPDGPHPGLPTYVSWSVANLGVVPILGLPWEARVSDPAGGHVVGAGVMPLLDYFDVDSIGVIVPPVSAGMRDTVRLALDPWGEIAEFNEENNTATLVLDENGLVVVGVEPPAGPAALELVARPNPFRSAVTVRFALPVAGRARVDVFTPDGRRVRGLWDAWLPSGEHALEWDGRDAARRPTAAGAYFVRLTAGPETRIAKVVRIR